MTKSIYSLVIELKDSLLIPISVSRTLFIFIIRMYILFEKKVDLSSFLRNYFYSLNAIVIRPFISVQCFSS